MNSNEEIEIKIDNPKDEIRQLLGEDYLAVTLTPVNFPEKMTLGEYWKQSHQGVFMLLTASKRQPEYGASVHITVLQNGTIHHATPRLLRTPLVAVHRVVEDHEAAN